MNSLEKELRSLAEPPAPAGLAMTVAARIASLEDQRPAPPGLPERSAPADTLRDRLAWASALTGMTAAIGAQVYRLAVGEAVLDATPVGVGAGIHAVVEMLPASPAVAVLAAGVLLVLAGLFAPLGATDPADAR